MTEESQSRAAPDSQSLEERRLAFEQKKWADELALRQQELEMKVREGTWSAKLVSPLTATLLVGIATVAGSVAATLIQNSHTLKLEQDKFKFSKEIEQDKFGATKTLETQKFDATKMLETQKQQHELILKMLTGTEGQSQRNLFYLASIDLIDEKTAKKIRETNSPAPVATQLALPAGLGDSPEAIRRAGTGESAEKIRAYTKVSPPNNAAAQDWLVRNEVRMSLASFLRGGRVEDQQRMIRDLGIE